MKMKKLLAVLLAAIMVFSIAGCGNGKDNTDPTKAPTDVNNTETTTEETNDNNSSDVDPETGLTPMADRDNPITFNIFVRDPGQAPAKDNPVLKKITELTGVTIQYEWLVGDLEQKIGVMLAGEEYPDAIFVGDSSPKFISGGALIPIEDMLPNYPNLYAHYSPHAEKMTAEDGHQYILEIFGVRKNAPPVFQNGGVGFYIQKAVLEDAGYPIPRTLDEYFELIDNYKAKYPEIDGVKTIGFEVLSDISREFCLLNPAQHLMGAGNDGGVYVDPVTYEASFYNNNDTAKAYYKKLNEEYHKGTIEAETFTQSLDQYISRLSTGAVLGFFDQQWNFKQGEDVLKTDGKWERTYVSVPITNEGVQDGYLDALTPESSFTGNNGIGITKNCKDPERLMAFYDWLLQPEVQDYLSWGIEGQDWTKVGETGRVLSEERRAIIRDTSRNRDETGHVLRNYSPKRQGLYDDGAPCDPDASEDEYLAGLSEYDQGFMNAYNIKYPAELMSEPVVRPKYYPVWAFTIEDGSPAKVANTKLADVTRQYYPRLVICKESEYDALWDEFLKAFDNANLQPYLDEVNRQIQERMK